MNVFTIFKLFTFHLYTTSYIESISKSASPEYTANMHYDGPFYLKKPDGLDCCPFGGAINIHAWFLCVI